MAQKVSFDAYRQGTLNFTSDDLSEYMYNAAITESTQYDYKDPRTGLSFQKLTSTRLLVVDPAFPVNAQILAAEWQIIFDTNYAPTNVKFVAKNQSAAVSSNWKSINDVLASLNWDGSLPVRALSHIYMQVFQLTTNSYIVGTLYTPSNPYIKLGYNAVGGANTIAAGAGGSAIPYDTIIEQQGAEEADTAALTAVTSGVGKGTVKIATPGKYIVTASFDSTAGASAGGDAFWIQIYVYLNGNVKARAYVPIIQSVNDGSIQVTTFIKITDADLTAIGSDKKANLYIVGTHGFINARQIDSTDMTQLCVAFIG